MKEKALVLSLALGISFLCVGCDDDKFNFFFSSDAGLFFFSFGNTVCTKPLEQSGTSAQGSGQSQSTSTQASTEPSTQSDTNSYQHLSRSFDLSTLTTVFDKMTGVPAASEPSTGTDKIQE